MKKLLCFFLMLSIILIVLPISAFATSGVTVQKESTNLRVGEEFVINIKFDAGQQVQAVGYTVEYDANALSFIGTSDNLGNNYEVGKVRYVAAGNTTTYTVSFTFRTKSAGDTTISVTDIIASDVEEYFYPSVSFSFTVGDGLIGDANGDGKVDTTDLATLKLYLAGSAAEINNLADFNNDSFINTTDLASLKLCLAGG